jgi:hypothetical protein
VSRRSKTWSLIGKFVCGSQPEIRDGSDEVESSQHKEQKKVRSRRLIRRLSRGSIQGVLMEWGAGRLN